MELVANFMSADVPAGEWASRRDEEGWHVLGCADHFYSPNRAYPHLWVTLATFAAVTWRVRLASSFANNLFRSPVEFAQAALQMHVVSGGRFEAGLGAGWDRAEAEGAGILYPPPGERAGRYAEAVQIVRQLLDTGSCRFAGRYYAIDVPALGPRPQTLPPLVASVGGDRTIREISPLVDRVELKIVSAATRGGSLDIDGLAAVPRSHLDDMVEKVRAVNPSAPLAMFVLCSVGDDERTRELEARTAGSFLGQFFGPPEKVAHAVLALGDAGISRAQISPFTEHSFELLAPHLGGP